MSNPIFVLNGPNLNLLGEREPEIYGSSTLGDIRGELETLAPKLGVRVDFRQTNHEGELIDWVQEARIGAAALIINAAGYTHTSISLRDAVVILSIPVIEVHLSNVYAREQFRRRNYLADVVHGTITGFGSQSYSLALTAAANLVTQKSDARAR